MSTTQHLDLASRRARDAGAEALDAMQGVLLTSTAAIPGVEHVALTLVDRPGRIRFIAASGDLPRSLDELQFTLREGPAVDLLAAPERVELLMDDQSTQRWGEFMPRARALGVKAGAAVRMSARGRTVGVLSIYATDAAALPGPTLGFARAFASHAATTVTYARQAQQLRYAMVTRQVIGQAVGMLMQRYALDESSAFGYLKRVSQNSNRKLRELAVELVDTRHLADEAGPEV